MVSFSVDDTARLSVHFEVAQKAVWHLFLQVPDLRISKMPEFFRSISKCLCRAPAKPAQANPVAGSIAVTFGLELKTKAGKLGTFHEVID